MRTYIIPIDPTRAYNSKLRNRKDILWPHPNRNYAIDDEIYMYISKDIGQIRFKVRIIATQVPATEEELYDPIWRKKEDLEKQIQRNNNDHFEFIKEYSLEEATKMNRTILKEKGYNPSPWPVEITSNQELLLYLAQFD